MVPYKEYLDNEEISLMYSDKGLERGDEDEEGDVVDCHRISTNIHSVSSYLLNGLNASNNDNILKSYYHSFLLLFKRCRKIKGIRGKKMLSQVYNFYISEIIPLTLSRVSGTSIALDLDIHIDIINMIAYILTPFPSSHRISNRQLIKSSSISFESMKLHWKPILTHLLRLISTIGNIKRSKEELIVSRDMKDKKGGGQPLGFFASMPIYVDLHNILLKQMNSGSTKASLDHSKLDLLAAASLKVFLSISSPSPSPSPLLPPSPSLKIRVKVDK